MTALTNPYLLIPLVLIGIAAALVIACVCSRGHGDTYYPPL